MITNYVHSLSSNQKQQMNDVRDNLKVALHAFLAGGNYMSQAIATGKEIGPVDGQQMLEQLLLALIDDANPTCPRKKALKNSLMWTNGALDMDHYDDIKSKPPRSTVNSRDMVHYVDPVPSLTLGGGLTRKIKSNKQRRSTKRPHRMKRNKKSVSWKKTFVRKKSLRFSRKKY